MSIDYEKWCRRCKNYAFDVNDGVLCGLTNAKPAFEGNCEHFVLDTERQQVVVNEKRRDARAGGRQKQIGAMMMFVAVVWAVGVLFFGRFPLWSVVIFFIGLGTYMRGNKEWK